MTNPTGGGGSGPGPDKTTPVINWSQPGPISNITPLGSAQLNAGANVSGTFAYSPAAGTVLATGSHTLSVTFTPTDTATYNTASATVTLQVVPFNQPVAGSNCSSPLNQGTQDFVYVSTGRAPNDSHSVFGFAAKSDGSLTAVPASPFTVPSGLWGVDVGAGSILFASGSVDAYSYAVHNDGCISLENTARVGQGDPANPSVTLYRLAVDSRNSNLYVAEYNGGGSNTQFASFAYDASTGVLNPTGVTDASMLYNSGVLALDSSSRFAVTADCSNRGGPGIAEFTLGENGGLTSANPADGPFPTAQSGSYWCPSGAAADHNGHFVIAMEPCSDGPPCANNPDWQLATYSIDADGKLTAQPNLVDLKNTPSQEGPNLYFFSPDNRYFAIAGTTSFSVYAWDSGSAALTLVASIPDTEGTCTFTPSSQNCTGNFFGGLAWDRYNHLYTTLGNKLLVYNVTDSGLTQAPGSPYPVQNPTWVTVVGATAP
jgi:hypothetical protein